jgi:subtilisin-like proprotein convertase family protein
MFVDMKPQKISIIFLLLVVAILTSIYVALTFNTFNLEVVKIEKVAGLRKQYANYLRNSPFKNTLKLTKKERIVKRLPPNKYYEREWELTMNPATGKPEPNKIYEIQKRLLDKTIAQRMPGDAADNAWIDRGPNNVGGRTRVVLFDPNDVTNKRVFAGGVSGGLWVNDDITNAASSWTQVSGVPGNMNISCITVDPNNSNTWYLGTGEQYTFGAAVGNGVYKTTDGGLNWIHVPVQLAGGGTVGTDFAGIYFINDIIAWNNGGSTEVFIGVGTHRYGDANPSNWLGFQNAGLYKSTDAGANWSRNESAIFGLAGWSGYFIIPNDFEISADNTLWFGSIRTPGTSSGGGKLFSSSDGVTWTEALASPLTTSDRVELAVSSTNANKLYALTEGDGTDPHIFVTTDAFATTTELAKPSDVDTGIPAADFTRGQAFYDLVIEVDPINDDIVYVGGIDLFRTTQGPNTNLAREWKQISKWSNNNNLAALTCSLVHADQHAFTFRPGANNEAVIGCDGGVYYASDLLNAETNDVFKAMNSDYNVTQFYYGGYGQDTANELIIAGAQDNGSQFMNGASPGANSSFDVYGGDGAYSTIDKDGDYMIVSYDYGNHYYKGLPYPGTNYIIDNNDNEGDFINPAGLDHNLNIMYSNGSSSSNRINRYTLGANSAAKAQLSNVLLSGNPTAFKVSHYTTTSSTLLVGTDDGKLLKITNADNFPSPSPSDWSDISGGSFVGSVSSIEFGETEDDIYVTFHNYGVTSIWYSDDGGANWENKEGDLPDMPVKCILQNPLALNEVLIGTELGVWTTTNFDDASPNWSQSYNGMRDVKVVDLDLRTSDNTILATTFGRGVFTGQFTATDFSFSAQESTVSTCTPNDAVFTFDFTAIPSYNTSTTFSTSGEPVGATINFSPNSISTTGTFTMTIGNIASIATGEYTITVTATGNDTYSEDVVLKVVDSNFGILTTISPANLATGETTNGVSFAWNEDTNATSYDIDIATDAGFTTIVETANVVTNSYSSSSILDSATAYYWRVRAKNECTDGSYSETQKFQTVLPNDCTIYANNTNVPINNIALSTSSINVSEDIDINKVRVSLNISHTWIQDLDITLVSPEGSAILFQNGCTDEDGLEVTFDDDASISISDICNNDPVIGIITPLESLSVFNNKSSNVSWDLEVYDGYDGDTGTINSWTLEICSVQSATNSNFINSPLTVGTNSTYTLKQAETEAISAGSTASEQVFMLTELPTVGQVQLNSIPLALGETFTQEDINTSKVSYANSSGVSDNDSFKVDIINATGGFLPNEEIILTIDSSLAIDNYFFEKTGISVFPTISNGDFSISSSKGIGKTTVEMYTLTGQKVFIKDFNFFNATIEHMNVQQLASGVYIIKLTADNLQGSKKVIIK